MERPYWQYLDRASLSCGDMEHLVDDYIDDVLPPALRERFEEHRAHCPICQSLVEDIQTIVQLARDLNREPLPSGIRERLRERLREEVGYDPPPTRKLTLIK